MNHPYKLMGILLILALLVSGCWDSKDLARLAIVAAVGIDMADEPGEILITIQIIKPAEVKSGGGGGGGGVEPPQKGGGQPAFLTVQSTGKTVSEAFRNFAKTLNRELYFSDNQFIIFGKDAATQGVRPLLDFFIRTREPRETVWILVSGGKAADVLHAQIGMERIPAMEIAQLVQNQTSGSQVGSISMHEFEIQLMSKTESPYATFIETAGGTEKKPRLSGIAVFNRDQLAGMLDEKETRGFLWVVGKVERGIITVPATEGGQVDIGILKVSSKISPQVGFNKLSIRVQVKAEFSVDGDASPADSTQPAVMSSLETSVTRAIRKEITAALIKARRLNADVFGFGEAIHRKYPKEWKQIEPQWRQLFITIPVKLEIKAVIKDTGLESKPPIPE